ncbi:MAG: ribosomal L7Ae/L30e/S12e/Gadd45 family protein [Veillonella sp.]|uniref:L7Ae/L30e/S12e/Gadd45 family ribosomal protein n=1 Tax=Veillonella sp. TaxID=1926307 RepID=UPI0025D47FFA|nr:ribosomal L7Ae/L30e/S12e/Gadd45 family protein [Veillonella sp.]MBS4912642.1 ribosomal L7Ae/L30e/S12e/Gadd45 family protein [Veillonella sp.]
MNKVKVLNLLGMAQRAGKLLSGDFVAEKAMKKQRIPLAILATDCAKNNGEKYRWLAQQHEVTLREFATKAELGQALGKEQRAIILVMDDGFAKTMLKEIDC